MTKILGMTKAYEQDKRFVESEKKQRLGFHQITPLKTTTVKTNNKNLVSISIRACYSKEKICKLAKNWECAKKLNEKQMKLRKKRYNLRSSTYQNAKLPNFRYRY